MKHTKCIACGKRIATITVAGNFLLSILKIFAGIVGGSHALIADGLHSGADVITSLVILFAMRISDQEPDEKHPYGHGNVEFIAASVVSAVLLIVVVFLFKDALAEVHLVTPIRPSTLTLFVAIVSMVVSEILFRLNNCAGKELKSPALLANASQQRADVYITGIAVVGILGAMAGIKWFDPAAVIAVGVVIIKTLIEIIVNSYAGLMDRGVPTEVKQHIEGLVNGIQGVKKIHSLRIRRLGQKFWVDLCIEVVPTITVAGSYKISSKIKETILFKVENIQDVQIETITG